MNVNSPEAIARRKASNVKHNPWNRWTQAEKSAIVHTEGFKPVRWTLDIGLVGTFSEDGFLYAYAGGPVEGTPQAEIKKRADGKVDGRSKGVRKCGKCQQTGHNTRTCPNAAVPKPPEEVRAARKVPGKQRVCSKCKQPGHNAATCGRPKSDATVPVRQAQASGKRQNTCKKCGGLGHNTRTCKA